MANRFKYLDLSQKERDGFMELSEAEWVPICNPKNVRLLAERYEATLRKLESGAASSPTAPTFKEIRDFLREEAWQGRWEPKPDENTMPIASEIARVLAPWLAARLTGPTP